MGESEYLLSNSEPETGVRFGGLEQTFDEVSIRSAFGVVLAPSTLFPVTVAPVVLIKWMALPPLWLIVLLTIEARSDR